MKHEEAFDRKRRARDKANKKFLKQRHRLHAMVMAATLLGAIIGGNIGLSVGPVVAAFGFIIGGTIGLVVGGAKVFAE